MKNYTKIKEYDIVLPELIQFQSFDKENEGAFQIKSDNFLLMDDRLAINIDIVGEMALALRKILYKDFRANMTVKPHVVYA